MSANSFGHFFKVHSFGESHGQGMGVIIDGMPAGVQFDEALLINNLERRRPGQSEFVSPRNEADLPEIQSGIYQNKTLGTPICVFIKNTNQKSEDYKDLKDRVGHADDVWRDKFKHVDPRGGGRASARETVSRVIAGSFAQMYLRSLNESKDLEVISYVSQIGHFKVSKNISDQNIKSYTHNSKLRTPDKDFEEKAQNLLLNAIDDGNSYGGWIKTKIYNPPKFLGEPVFYKLKSELSKAIMTIGACVGFNIGEDLSLIELSGKDFHESMNSKNYGGIRGGISTGETITFNAAFKPTSSIKSVAKSGRHDPCILPRAASVVEAMSYLVLADLMIWKRSKSLD